MAKELILKTPRHTLYGFGAMKKGDTLILTPSFGDTMAQLRAHVNGFGNYHGLKFKTSIAANKEQLTVARVK